MFNFVFPKDKTVVVINGHTHIVERNDLPRFIADTIIEEQDDYLHKTAAEAGFTCCCMDSLGGEVITRECALHCQGGLLQQLPDGIHKAIENANTWLLMLDNEQLVESMRAIVLSYWKQTLKVWLRAQGKDV